MVSCGVFRPREYAGLRIQRVPRKTVEYGRARGPLALVGIHEPVLRFSRAARASATTRCRQGTLGSSVTTNWRGPKHCLRVPARCSAVGRSAPSSKLSRSPSNKNNNKNKSLARLSRAGRGGWSAAVVRGREASLAPRVAPHAPRRSSRLHLGYTSAPPRLQLSATSSPRPSASSRAAPPSTSCTPHCSHTPRSFPTIASVAILSPHGCSATAAAAASVTPPLLPASASSSCETSTPAT
mmetsp:Transcript_18201/g.61133  ORF Transcript_18201/g.61133 Transcript_18201/m.61133 type:complete len:239 (-) Transcript_18201:442-1158(-)